MFSRLSKPQVFALVATVIIFTIYQMCPVIQTESKIRQEMLKKFPVGTSKDIIWNYAKDKDPKDAYTDNRSWWKNNDQSSKERIGDSRIKASITNLPIIDITIIWLFDKDNKLIETYAWRTMDLL